MADEQPALLPDPFMVGRWSVEPRGSDWLDTPSVGAGDRRIAYERWQSEANVYRLDLHAAAAEPERLLSSTRWHWHVLLLERSDTGTR